MLKRVQESRLKNSKFGKSDAVFTSPVQLAKILQKRIDMYIPSEHLHQKKDQFAGRQAE